MTPRIMTFNMRKLRRTLSKRVRKVPIQIPHPRVNRRISTANVSKVAFEMLHIHHVEADDGCVESDVGFGDLWTVVEWSFGVDGAEVVFDFVEGGEEGCDGFFVGGLGGGEAGFVDAVVDVVVGPFVGGFDFCLEVGGEEVYLGKFGGQEVVEFGVEHADDFAGFIVHDFFLLDVVQGRDGESARVFGVLFEIDVAQMRVFFVNRVGLGVGSRDFFVGGGESPRLLSHVPVHGSVRDEFFETFELAHNQGSVRPGTGVRDIEVVTTLFSGELGIGFLGYPVAEGG